MNFQRNLAVLGLIGVITLVPALTEADTLEITDESFTPVPQTETLVVPGRGMTMDQVRQEFGEPNNILPAVGDPPITRWEYTDFVVHFEHSFVIHTVVSTTVP